MSQKDDDDLAGQVKDALRFLSAKGPAIRALVRRKGVETASLDFGIERRADALVQVDVFPAELALARESWACRSRCRTIRRAGRNGASRCGWRGSAG